MGESAFSRIKELSLTTLSLLQTKFAVRENNEMGGILFSPDSDATFGPLMIDSLCWKI